MVRILWRGNWNQFERARIFNFLYVHEKFVSPDDIIKDDSASIDIINE